MTAEFDRKELQSSDGKGEPIGSLSTEQHNAYRGITQQEIEAFEACVTKPDNRLSRPHIVFTKGVDSVVETLVGAMNFDHETAIDYATRIATNTQNPESADFSVNHPADVISKKDLQTDQPMNKERQLEVAVSKLVAITGKLNGTATDSDNYRINSLIEGLRDPGSQTKSIKRVEVWYDTLFPNNECMKRKLSSEQDK